MTGCILSEKPGDMLGLGYLNMITLTIVDFSAEAKCESQLV